MAESSFSFRKLLDQCENQELGLQGCYTPVYGQLLALYLLHNDMNNARYLWKRIPPAIKSANSELGGIWSVGQRIWQRSFLGSTAPSTLISGLRPSSQSWSSQRCNPETSLRPGLPSLHPRSSPTISQPLLDFGGGAVKGILEQGWQADSTTRMVMPRSQLQGPWMFPLTGLFLIRACPCSTHSQRATVSQTHRLCGFPRKLTILSSRSTFKPEY